MSTSRWLVVSCCLLAGCTSVIETSQPLDGDADSDSQGADGDVSANDGDGDGTSDGTDGDAAGDGGSDGDGDGGDVDLGDTGLVRVNNTTCQLGTAPPPDLSAATFTATQVYSSLSLDALTGLLPIPDGSGRLAAVEQSGRVTAFDPSSASPTGTTYVDLRARVLFSSEQGLHSIAFHPDFATNGELYVMYSIDPSGDSNVSRFARSSSDPTVIDPTTEEILLTIDRPNSNHNGGQIFFGLDGYLYVSMGDSGSGGDPLDLAQDTNALQGKLLRLDVDNVPGGQTYGIPPTNPFVGQAGKREEIYAYGLRNPWRVSQDPVTGILWCADVGQNAVEEIDTITSGGNYGWNEVEGDQCYTSGCNLSAYIPPVYAYDHANGRCSITGGFVYRGTQNAELVGKYLFGDYCTGEVWALDPASGTSTFLFDDGFGLQSFGLDADGEIYLLKSDGSVRLVTRGGGPNTSDFPTTLSATGCYSDLPGRVPAAGVVPFEVAAPFWSDGAVKRRFFALPTGTNIGFVESGSFQWPVGTILMKEFTLELTPGTASSAKPVETRFLIQRSAGTWEGYTYEWNDAGTDATLLDGSNTKSYTLQTGSGPVDHDLYLPARSECIRCHNAAAGRSLGTAGHQLNRDTDYGTGPVNQLAALAAAGFFAAPLPASPSALARLANPFDTSLALDVRARAYLHANCSQCHRSGGEMPLVDYRVGTALGSSGICNVITPGNAAGSVLIQRAGVRDTTQMPPLGSLHVDTAGIALLSAWINSLSSCP